ncbi:MAG: M81 family metallopeptidase [Candidatus Competibacteraceae bacterium]|nr:M81 family metallopeptidase [Candidatus Competibacteraceae bacterium]
MRIFAASLATETNMFSPIPTSVDNFLDAFYAPPGEHPDRPSLCSAPLWVARHRAQREGWTLIEGSTAWAEPSGTCAQAAYERFRDEILAQISAALPLDGVLLGLHGAMVAHAYDDCEGDLITRVRELVGARAIIGVEHDLHCHLTRQRLRGADILITFKEFPHTDPVERAEEVLELTLQAIRGEIKPIQSVVDCRQIASYPTSREPMRSFVDKIQALEGHNGVLSISVAHGFPFADVAEMGTRVLVITDDNKAYGDQLAAELAAELVAMRGKSTPPFLTAPAAVAQALQNTTDRPVVIADPTDNPGGGAPGDSTHLLRELLEQGAENAILGPLWDPVAVQFCHAAGIGARLQLRFGGKTAVASGQPLDAEVDIVNLAKNASQSFSGGQVPLGDTALIRLNGIEIVLIEKRTQTLGRDLFTHLGVDLTTKRIISVKSTNHFHAAFAPIAAEVIYTDADGPLPRDVRKVPYQKVQRPIWPLDDVAEPVRIV